MSPARHWLVTGGCGFIGTALVNKLAADDRIMGIRVLDNLSVGKPEDIRMLAGRSKLTPNDVDGPPTGLELVEGDIRDLNTCKRAIQGCTTVVHLAANTGVPQSVEDPQFDCCVNVIGTFNLLTAAREERVAAFVFASSGAPLGEVEPPIHEELAPHPVSPYGASKLAGEGYCSAFFRTYGVPTVVLRFGNVYGPGSKRKTSVVAKFIRQALDGTFCEVYGDGGQTRDFLYIDDLVTAVLAAARKAPAGEIFQIASGKERTINEISQILQHHLRVHGVSMRLRQAPPRRGDVQRNFSDTSKAQTVLGWSPDTTLEKGLEETVRHLLDTYKHETS